MRKPSKIECLHLDFDGFFASVEQQARPRLRGKPVGIIPFEGTEYTCVIACSKEAKAHGCSNIMSYAEAKAKCPEIILQPQCFVLRITKRQWLHRLDGRALQR